MKHIPVDRLIFAEVEAGKAVTITFDTEQTTTTFSDGTTDVPVTITTNQATVTFPNAAIWRAADHAGYVRVFDSFYADEYSEEYN